MTKKVDFWEWIWLFVEVAKSAPGKLGETPVERGETVFEALASNQKTAIYRRVGMYLSLRSGRTDHASARDRVLDSARRLAPATMAELEDLLIDRGEELYALCRLKRVALYKGRRKRRRKT